MRDDDIYISIRHARQMYIDLVICFEVHDRSLPFKPHFTAVQHNFH